MIFVTVGTNEAPFDRLLRALDELPGGEELVVQHGASGVRPQAARCLPFVPFDELVWHVRLARAVVMHAGVGSIMVALANGKRPVVVPRLARHGEAVDDHQVELATRLGAAGLVTVAEDAAQLRAALEAGTPARPVSLNELPVRLASELRDYVTGAVAAAHAGRP